MQYIPKTGLSTGLPKELPKNLFAKLLNADSAHGEIAHLYEKSHMALAGLVPVAFLSGEGSPMSRICDLGMAVVLPFHSHVAMNGVVSDYVPPNMRVPARYALVGASTVMALGLLKLSVFGPGLTDTVRSLWKSDKPAIKAQTKAAVKK